MTKEEALARIEAARQEKQKALEAYQAAARRLADVIAECGLVALGLEEGQIITAEETGNRYKVHGAREYLDKPFPIASMIRGNGKVGRRDLPVSCKVWM